MSSTQAMFGISISLCVQGNILQPGCFYQQESLQSPMRAICPDHHFRLIFLCFRLPSLSFFIFICFEIFNGTNFLSFPFQWIGNYIFHKLKQSMINMTGKCLLTLFYMQLELFYFSANPTFGSDVCSLGVYFSFLNTILSHLMSEKYISFHL